MESLFGELNGLSTQDRAAKLSKIEDVEVRDEVASLLENSHDGETVAAAVGAIATHINPLPTGEQRFGPFLVVARLGQGGQGAVFEARRDDGSFDQRVAIKIIKWDVDSEAARAQFARERQILAALEHPYIARLIDGGQREDGTPYLIMEYVEGLPLTAAAAGWALRRKLELFLQVMEAVEFAHRNLVIHRDLKPANILVTPDGTPKLLDFGIAKLLDVDTQRTQTVVMAYTPDYASPEQVRGMPISTTSDVYSLGVVLYQLLTGRKPYSIETATLPELDRVVCQKPPDDPKLGDDLDQILMMALRKDPARRYQSVAQFAEDIRRYMDRRPVLARPDTFWYRTQLYTRRHWVGLVAASITLVAVIGGTGAAFYQGRIAAQRFQMVRKLARSFVFDYNDELAKIQGNTGVREKMVTAALEYLDTLSQSAGSDLDLQQELAAAYKRVGDTQGNPTSQNLGHTEQAIASYRKAAELYDRLQAKSTSFDAQTAEFYSAFTALLVNTGNWREARPIAEKALSGAQRLAKARPDDETAQLSVPKALSILSDVDDFDGHPEASAENVLKADAAMIPVLARWRNAASIPIAEGIKSRLASFYKNSGQLEAAETAYQEDAKIVAEMLRLAPDDPRHQHTNLFLLQDWSSLYYDDLYPSFNDPAKCLALSRQAVDIARQATIKDPKDMSARITLAASLFRMSFPLKHSDPPAAVRAAEESVRILDDLIATDKSFSNIQRHARAERRLGQALVAAGHAAESVGHCEKSVADERVLVLREEPQMKVSARLGLSLLCLAEAQEAARNPKRAIEYLLEAEQMLTRLDERDPEDFSSIVPLSHARQALAAHFTLAGDHAQARNWHDSALKLWREFSNQNAYVSREVAKLAALHH